MRIKLQQHKKKRIEDTDATVSTNSRFQDNRPEAISQRRLTDLANKKSTPFVIQKKSSPISVTGLTHLVEKKGNSLMKGKETIEVDASKNLSVETDVRLRSRRGPNQESTGDYDRRGEHIYRWYLVDGLDYKNIKEYNWYIREDTFNMLKDSDIPKTSKDLSAAPDKRTRQSHVAVRFEVWYNEDKELDKTGHLVMKDHHRGGDYLTYERDPTNKVEDGGQRSTKLEGSNIHAMDKDQYESHTQGSISVKGLPSSNFMKLNSTWPEDRSEMESRLKKQTRSSKTRFNKKYWVEILVTQDEYKLLNSLFEVRQKGGFYAFYREARTVAGFELATRCLSSLEDIALSRNLPLKSGHAEEVAKHFSLLQNITQKHQGEEPV